jgi:hypothetical protein
LEDRSEAGQSDRMRSGHPQSQYHFVAELPATRLHP